MLKLYDKNYVFYIRFIFKSFDNFMHSQNIQITFYLKFNKYKYIYIYIFTYDDILSSPWEYIIPKNYSILLDNFSMY